MRLPKPLRTVWTATVDRMRGHWLVDLERERAYLTSAADERANATMKSLRNELERERAQLASAADERANSIMTTMRNEYTVMPRFAFHQPLDYSAETFPPEFEPPVHLPTEPLPLPPPPARMGYPSDDKEYLAMGRYDHDLIMGIIAEHGSGDRPLHILDFGCSSGRVLRHFHAEHVEKGWQLYGVDIQALPIEWMRRNFPSHFRVFTSNVLPHLQFPDNSIDVIYGVSVFTHTKFLWDAWLMELRRVLRPGGLLIQTIHTEAAWSLYYEHRKEPWVFQNHAPSMLKSSKMEVDFLYYGDIGVSQVFWKREIAREFWSRYLTVLDLRPPPPRFSFQDWMICRKD